MAFAYALHYTRGLLAVAAIRRDMYRLARTILAVHVLANLITVVVNQRVGRIGDVLR